MKDDGILWNRGEGKLKDLSGDSEAGATSNRHNIGICGSSRRT